MVTMAIVIRTQEKYLDSACQFLQKCLKEEKGLLDSIVVGDETRQCHFISERKQISKQWRQSWSPVANKFKQTPSAGKVMTTVS
ncbi:hypothetical protein NPIL_547441 [Nephila pilipes]|uniref:Uncharacterized protein n=1 Tax=Nephila pilipes TaxID=299642 RepID=A0A8X6PFW7_NEPPI|nr:hypothetical protein NPIL_547441 [Nephila pilipes]